MLRLLPRRLVLTLPATLRLLRTLSTTSLLRWKAITLPTSQWRLLMKSPRLKMPLRLRLTRLTMLSLARPMLSRLSRTVKLFLPFRRLSMTLRLLSQGMLTRFRLVLPMQLLLLRRLLTTPRLLPRSLLRMALL